MRVQVSTSAEKCVAGLRVGVEGYNVDSADPETADMKTVLAGMALYGCNPESPVFDRDANKRAAFGLRTFDNETPTPERMLDAIHEIEEHTYNGHDNSFLTPENSEAFQAALVWAGNFRDKRSEEWPRRAGDISTLQLSSGVHVTKQSVRRLNPFFGLRHAAYQAGREMMKDHVLGEARLDAGALRPSRDAYEQIMGMRLGMKGPLTGAEFKKLLVPGSLTYNVSEDKIVTAVVTARATMGVPSIQFQQYKK